MVEFAGRGGVGVLLDEHPAATTEMANARSMER